MKGFHHYSPEEFDRRDVEPRGPQRGRPMRHGSHPGGPREEGGPFGHGGRGRGRRSRRGDVRAAVLLLLDEKPRNGYQLIQELEARSKGTWRPSPGSIYPVLSQLEDEGLVVVEAHASGRTFALTDTGRAMLAERREAFGQPWEAVQRSFSDSRVEFMRTLKQVAAASRQVLEAGADAQVDAAAHVLKEARRSLYRILAEDDGEQG